MKTFFSYLNSIRAVSLCIWKQSQLPTKQPQQYIDGSKMKYVYNLIFLQLPGCLKSNYSYFTYFHIYVLRPHPQVSLRHLMGVLPGGTTGPAWSTVPHLLQVSTGPAPLLPLQQWRWQCTVNPGKYHSPLCTATWMSVYSLDALKRFKCKIFSVSLSRST